MEFPFIKLHTDYYDDVVLASLDDAAEVMFTRGLAHCGSAGTGGLILTSKLMTLSRKTTLAQAKKVADRLTQPIGDFEGPWVKVPAGYQVRNWSVYQDRLDALELRRKSDRDRKRRSRGQSRDTSRDVTGTEIETEIEAAAAAPRAARGGKKIPLDDLPPAVLKLRDRFAALTVLHTVRFTDLTPDWLERLEPLIAKHGVDTLTDFARRTQRPVGGVSTVQGFIPTWDDIAAPRAVVDEPMCPCGLTVANCDGMNAKLDPEHRCTEREVA